jgi:cytochrome P450
MVRDLAELKYSEMIIKGAMRPYPPAWLLTTRTLRETVHVGGQQMNPGDWREDT